MRLDELPAKLLKVGLFDSFHEILLAFHGTIGAISIMGKAPKELKDATVNVLQKETKTIECGN